MAILHNQINSLWHNSTYEKFRKSGFVRQIFKKEDATTFIKTGAHLILLAKKENDKIFPYDPSRDFEFRLRPRISNAFFSLGAEYILKGVYLWHGYAINKLKPGIIVPYPTKLRGNIKQLCENEVVKMKYLVDNFFSLPIDLRDFDIEQKRLALSEAKKYKGKKMVGIKKLSIPSPTSKQILDYIYFKRNYSLHRPFVIPEFLGTTNIIFKFIDYLLVKVTGKGTEEHGKI